MAIGEAPGRVEDQTGIPFTGQTGEEWDHTYLPLAGLNRSEVFVTNVRQCRPHQNRKPTEKEIEVCGNHHLPSELDSVNPSIVFLMGATACSVPGLLSSTPINLEVEHGIPRRGLLFGKEYWLVPMFHPALGLHQTSAMIEILEDWGRLGPWIREYKWQWPVPDLDEHLDYRLAHDADDVCNYWADHRRDKGSLMAIDTETHAGNPWGIQLSIKPGTALMCLIDPRKDGGLEMFADSLKYHLLREHEFVFHNAPADIAITEDIIGQKIHEYRDTMQEAYQLGNLPQGLKALGYRLCGIRMKSWDEVVGEASRVKLMSWMMDRISEEAAQPLIEHKQLKTRLKVIEKPNGIESALRRILSHTVESTTYDPWERLEGLGFMEMPVKGIKNCKLAEAVQYGCRDADVTLRVALKLGELRRQAQAGWAVQESDYDH